MKLPFEERVAEVAARLKADELAAQLPELADSTVDHPAHYADGWSNGAEVIDITENLNFNRGNAVKYLARAGVKNPDTEIEDLRKAAWYVQREIARLGAWPL